MSELEFYVCHAGQSLEAYKADSEDNTEMGVIGVSVRKSASGLFL
jgi:hypothetical protein